MSDLSLCRVCLSSDVKMRHIANTRYKEFFEKFSANLSDDDGKPDKLCFICYFKLQRCCEFVDMSRKAEEVLTNLSRSGIKLNKDAINILDSKFGHKLRQTPLQFLSVNTFKTTLIKNEYDLSNIKVESVNEDINADVMNAEVCVKQEIYEGDLTDTETVVKQELEIENCLDEEDEAIKMEREARMLVKLKKECLNSGSIEGQSSNSVNSASVNEKPAEQTASTVTENIIITFKADSPSILANDGNSGDETTDFSDDSGDEYKLEQYVQCSSFSTSSSNELLTEDFVGTSNLMDASQDLAPSETVTEKRKKRVRNVSGDIKKLRKRLRNSGKQYISRTGRTVAEKYIKLPCTEKCRLKCRNKITEKQRQEIFECYWGLGTLQKQRAFLNSCLTTLKVPCRRVKEGGGRRRQNCVFHLTVNGKSKRTCKTFFMNTLGVSERKLRTVIEARSAGVVPDDKRGKHGHHKSKKHGNNRIGS